MRYGAFRGRSPEDIQWFKTSRAIAPGFYHRRARVDVQWSVNVRVTATTRAARRYCSGCPTRGAWGELWCADPVRSTGMRTVAPRRTAHRNRPPRPCNPESA